MNVVERQEYIDKVLDFATNAHEGQTRDDGTPYIQHPLRVAYYLTMFWDAPDEVYAASVLHDTVEDCDVTLEDIKNKFGAVVADLVSELTNDKEECKVVGKVPYMVNKMLNMSEDALTIKLADRYDNVCDIKTAKSESWRKKYKADTIEIMKQVSTNRVLTSVQLVFADAIMVKCTE